MLSITKISKKFSTVVPSKIRKRVGLSFGDMLAWEVKGEKIEVTPRKKVELEDLIGIISVGGDAVASKKRVQRGLK